jgi:hypothetical protein
VERDGVVVLVPRENVQQVIYYTVLKSIAMPRQVPTCNFTAPFGNIAIAGIGFGASV